MNIRPQLEDSLNFVTRQVSELILHQGHSLESAVAKLKALDSINSDPEVISAIATLQHLNSDEVVDKNLPHSFKVLSAIIRKSASQSLGAVVCKFTALTQRIDNDVDLYLHGLRNTIIYCFILIGVALITASIASLKVLPGMLEAYDKFGSRLPNFTQFMINYGIDICVVALTILLLYTVLLLIGLYSLRRNVSHFRVMPSRNQWRLLLGPIINVVNSHVIIGYLSLFKQSGFADDQLIDHSEELIANTGRSVSIKHFLGRSLYQKISASISLNTVDRELDYQLNETTSEIIKSLSRFRKTLNIGVLLVIYSAIAGIVISFYLPIFMIGSAI